MNTLPSNLCKPNLPKSRLFCLFVKLIYDFEAKASLVLILSNFHDSRFCWLYKIKKKNGKKNLNAGKDMHDQTT